MTRASRPGGEEQWQRQVRELEGRVEALAAENARLQQAPTDATSSPPIKADAVADQPPAEPVVEVRG